MADMIAPSLVIGLAFGRIGCLLNGCCYGGLSDRPWAVTFPPTSPPYQDQVAHGDMLGFHLAADNLYRPTVVRVEANSPAAKAGVAVGDVLAGVNGSPTPLFDQAATALVEAAALHESTTLQLTSGRTLVLPAAELPPRSRPVLPTQIFSSINAGLLCWFLWSYYPFRRRDGEVVALLLTIYPITRFLLEILRIDESPVFGTGLSISQNISLVVFVGAIGLWCYLAHRPLQRAWDAGLCSATS
jgi:phosphatidylglycerol---prolipoprotein diacylglyceryl transferase